MLRHGCTVPYMTFMVIRSPTEEMSKYYAIRPQFPHHEVCGHNGTISRPGTTIRTEALETYRKEIRRVQVGGMDDTNTKAFHENDPISGGLQNMPTALPVHKGRCRCLINHYACIQHRE